MKGSMQKKIRELREIRGWSQSALAAMAGVSLRTIQRAEKEGRASVETLKSLAAVFELNSHHELNPTHSRKPQTLRGEKRKHFNYQGKTSFLPNNDATHLIFMTSVALFICHIIKFEGSAYVSPIVDSAAMSALFFYTLISLLQLRRKARTNQLTLAQHLFSHGHATSLSGYLSKYPLEKNAMMVGEVKASVFSHQLIRHTHASNRHHMLAVGEHGSAHYLVMLAQLFHTLCEQRSGLILLDERDAPLVYHISSTLSSINREDDLGVYDADTLAQWKAEDWMASHSLHSVIVGITNQDVNKSHMLTLNFMDSIKPKSWLSVDEHYNRDGVFLWVNDKHIPKYDSVIDKLKDVSLYGRLRLILSITEAERFADLDDATKIASYFEHRYVLKIRNPATVSKIHRSLFSELYNINTDPLRTISFGPGVGDYFFNGKAYENVRFVYFEPNFKAEIKADSLHVPLQIAGFS